jgi:hypothetical protein
MLILFDNGTPRGLARFLTGHSVEEARARGWEELENGALIDVAGQAGFEVIVTTDKISDINRTSGPAKSRSLCSGIHNGPWLRS